VNSKQKLAQQVFTVSHLKGEFRLRSGAVSYEYFDKYLFETDPIILKDISQAMSKLVPTNVDALAGLELGGIPLVTILSQMTGLPAIFVRKVAKSHGTCKLAEGGETQGRKLLIVEDVATSGGQIINSTCELRKLGADVSDVLCVIDRETGAVENLAKENLTLHSLFTMSELRSLAKSL